MSTATAPREPMMGISEEEINRDVFGFLAAMRESDEPVAFVPSVNAWVVSSWDGVHAVLDAGDILRARPTYLVRPSFGGEMASSVPNGANHQARRRGWNAALSPRVVETWADKQILPMVNGRLDRIVDRGRGELLHDVISPVAMDVLAYALGIPDIPYELRWEWYEGISAGVMNFTAEPGQQNRSWELSDAISEYLRPMMGEKWEQPDDTLMSQLIHNAHGESFGERFAFSMPDVKVAIFAGSQEPAHATVNGMIGLLGDEAVRNRFMADPWGLIEQAVEESLRWMPPLSAFMRRAAETVEIEGVTIPQEDFLLVSAASANRQKAVFGEDSEEFSLDRYVSGAETPRYVTFGRHPRFCAGNYLVKATMRRLIPTLFERLPNLRLDPERHSLEGTTILMNVVELHTRWDVPA